MWGVSAAEIQATVAGINHLTWILDLKVKGRAALTASAGTIALS